MCTNAGSGYQTKSKAERNGSGKIIQASKAELSNAQSNAAERMRQAFENDDRSAYRDAAANFVKLLSNNDTVTAITVQNYQNARGGKILSQSPTIWKKNPDGTISRNGSTSKETPEEWARKRWRSSNANVYYLKGNLTIQQAATELSKIKKRHYEVKDK